MKVNLPTDLVNSVERLHIAVFASGRGSNFQALLQAIEEKRIPNADIVLVVSNNSDAGALEVARKHDIPAVHLSQKQFATEEEFNHALLQTVENHSVSFVARVGSSKLAVRKAREAGLTLERTAVASDAFFPFADGLLEAMKAGATAVIQPGGSIRDEEVIRAADDHHITMVFTGVRHFKH
ncbi:MAG: formyltransferase family protein [Bacteroidota bacterium]